MQLIINRISINDRRAIDINVPGVGIRKIVKFTANHFHGENECTCSKDNPTEYVLFININDRGYSLPFMQNKKAITLKNKIPTPLINQYINDGEFSILIKRLDGAYYDESFSLLIVFDFA